LVDHLVTVAGTTGDANGSLDARLGFLAGLLHDVAKCHEDWQEFIDPATTRKKGPPHAPMGAALFCFAANKLISDWCQKRSERRDARDQMLNWTLAVQGHHGKLGDFSATTLPWLGIGNKHSVSGMVAGCDLDGAFDLVRQYFPSFTATANDFSEWLGEYDRDWLDLVEYDRKSIAETGAHHEIAMRFPRDFSRLIVADRNDAGQLLDDGLSPADAKAALVSLADYCADQAADAIEEGAARELVQLRGSIQDRTAATYKADPSASFYTLLLPTGYGKTLTSLRTALDACAAEQCRRIIYVAPYISILSQAAKEIAQASGLRVFEHHHLSLAKIASQQEAAATVDALSSEFLKDSDDDFEVLDTWKAPVVATTFNQFFRALFPKRAQHTLRIDAVERAFVIIDEPQIIDVAVWNVFLRALDVFASQHQCQVIFSTATLPPLDIGLKTKAIALAPSAPSLHRYDIEYLATDHSLPEVMELVQTKIDLSPNAAIVLNTVRDAFLLFKVLRQGLESRIKLHCLTAMMLPHHKHRVIREIREHLKQQRHGTTREKLAVVCTQILEAGVNLSFRVILRARSIFPSIAQVAGRANRHNEGQPAKVYVFPFKSDGENELRRYVYRDATARRLTDRVFDETPVIPETRIVDQLHDYFDDCWQENSQSTLLRCFQEAALGEWSRLADIDPFGFSPPREEVFVPLPLSTLDDDSRTLIERFAPQGPEQLLERHLDKDFQRSLGFREKKLFNVALRQFIVPTRLDIAEQVADRLNEWLWLINDTAYYSDETGLAHWLDQEQPDEHTTFVI